MHIAGNDRLVIHLLYNLQVSAMHIDGIIHHTFIQAVAGNDLALTTREVGCIRLCSKISRIVFATQANIELFKGYVFRNLSQQAHTFRIVYTDIFKAGVFAFSQEDTRSRSFIITHGYLRSRHQTRIFPMRRTESTFIQLFRIIGRTPEVTGLVHHMAGLSIKCNAGLRIVCPSFAITFKMSIFTYSCLGPRFNAINHTIITTLHYLNLSDMRFSKVNTEILQHGIFRTYNRNRKHPAIEIEISTTAVHGQIFPVFQCQTYRFRIRLVMIGNVIFLLKGTVSMEVVSSLFKKQSHFLPFVFLLDNGQSFLHLGRKILFRIRHNTIITHVYSLLL